MSENDEIKKLQDMFEKFSSRFEEIVFTLISKFNEIHDSYNRVQEAMDYLGKIQIQIAENKQLMTNVTKSFKDIDRRMREIDFEQIGEGEKKKGKKKKKVKMEIIEDTTLLDVEMVETKESPADDLKEFGDESELPTLEDIKTIKESSSETEPEPSSEPIPSYKPEPEPELESEPESELEPAPEPVEAFEPEPESEPEPASEPVPAYEPENRTEPVISPVPKPPEPILSPESEVMTPAPKRPDLKSLPKRPENKPQPEIAPAPVPSPAPEAPSSTKSELPPVPKPPEETLQEKEPEPTPELSEEAQELAAQRIMKLTSKEDVFHNLLIDIDISQNYRQIGVSLKLASDLLKQFIKFHKVLFEMLRLASTVNREIGDISDEYREEIKTKIEEWKEQLNYT